MPPFLDLRYITSFTNTGVDIACQTFQRRFSRRYVPARAAPGGGALALLPGTLSGSAPGSPAAAAAAGAAEAAVSPEVGAAGALDAAAEGGEAAALLDDRALADMERSLGKTLGPVDPSLKMQVCARSAASWEST